MTTAQQRVDARDKVTGALRYGADRAPEGLAYATFAVAPIGKGRVVSVDTDAAHQVPGVCLVITRIHPDELKSPGYMFASTPARSRSSRRRSAAGSGRRTHSSRTSGRWPSPLAGWDGPSR